MPRRSKRAARPSTPAEILSRRRIPASPASPANTNDPSSWGVLQNAKALAANEDLVVVADPHRRGKVTHARRSDAFSLVEMSDDQLRAARRYERDWLIRAGVDVFADELRPDKVDAYRGTAPGQGRSWLAIDAGARIEAAHRGVGPTHAALLQGVVEPLAMRGEVRVWRVLVQMATGETHRTVQGAMVRAACEDLRQVYLAIDAAEERFGALKAQREARKAAAKAFDRQSGSGAA